MKDPNAALRAALGSESLVASVRAGSRAVPKAEDLSLLQAFLALPLVMPCSPACCDHSWVRAEQIRAIRHVLTTLRRRDPARAAALDPVWVAAMAAPGNRRLALPMVELIAATPEARVAHQATLLGAIRHPRWQVVLAAVRGVEDRTALDEARDHPHHQVRRAAERAWRLRFGDGCAGRRDVACRVRLGQYRRYRYVGPERIRLAVKGQPEGTPIRSLADLAAWGKVNPGTSTYVVDESGCLRVAPRHSEHVACAGGRPVLAAGELASAGDRVSAVTNQSTGYCPDPSAWRAVADAFAAAGVRGPGRWTIAFTFRRCACGQVNLVKEGEFVCAVCGLDLPRAWNFGD